MTDCTVCQKDGENDCTTGEEHENSFSTPYVPDLFTITEVDTDKNKESENNSMTENTLQSSRDVSAFSDTSILEDEMIEFKAGPLKTFMDVKETIDLLKGPYIALPKVPLGRKDGMYFIVDNRINIQNRAHGKRSEFWDDCGTWVKGTTPCTAYLIRDGKFSTIVKKENQYCWRKQSGNKRLPVPMDPQPNQDEVIEVHRFYHQLKATASDQEPFRRRVSWIERSCAALPNVSTDVAVIEYTGNFPKNVSQGFSKDQINNAHYIRTKHDVIRELTNELEKKEMKEIERQLNQTISDDFSKQTNEKQLRNIKCIQPNHSDKTTSKIADQAIYVEEMTKTHELVKSVSHIQGCPHPLVTLYTDQQIVDLKRFCCTEMHNSVLGIDKTYNLGEFFVTPTVYIDKSVIKRTTNDHPVCFGPLFIHPDSSAKTYQAFLHDIADQLSDFEISRLAVGSDEEDAFKKAVKRCFNGCTHVLCTRHLKENTDRHMETIAGYTKRDRDRVLDAIYGKSGLTEKTDADTFNYRVAYLIELVEKTDSHTGEKKFLPYLTNRLLPLLKEYVIGPINIGRIPTTWYNNNSESANHILKSGTKWKVQDMPRFITTIFGIIKCEQKERCSAIWDTENYRLSTTHLHHSTEATFWATMSEENCQERTNKFLMDVGKSNSNTVVSSDSCSTVLRTSRAGSEQNQRKRKGTESTNTPLTKRKL